MTRTAFLYLDKNACSVISFWFRIDVIVWRQLEPCVFYAYSFGCTHFLFKEGKVLDLTKWNSFSEIENIEQKQQLEKTYQIPTLSYPVPMKNGFPLLNQNCMIYGNCFPK